MALLINYWNAIIGIGSTSNMEYDQRARLATLNAICIISIGMVSLFTLGFVSSGSYSAVEALLVLPVMLLVLYFNSRKLYSYARLLIIYFLLIVLLALALGDRRTGTEYILIAVGCLSVFVFENIASILMALLATALCYGFYAWYDATHPFVPDPTIPYTFVQNTSLFIATFIVIAQLLVFRTLTSLYAKKLGEANRKIQVANEELQATNEELRAQSEHLDLLVKQKSSELQAYIDAINLSIYSAITNVAGTILKVNKPLMDVSGYSEHELIGQNFRMLNSGHHSEVFFKDLMETIHAGKSWRGEIKNKAKDGSFFWISMMIMPIKSEKGTNNYFLSLAMPITERKEAEYKQLKSVKVLESIAFRASHNVRGPITRMQGLMDLIDQNLIEQHELTKVAQDLKFSINEIDAATGELTQFVNNHYESIAIPVE
jgi:PAS domain S-box-containing protein